MTTLRLLASLVALALFVILPGPSVAGDKYGGPDGGGYRHHDGGIVVVPGVERRGVYREDRRFDDRRRYDDRRRCREFDPRRPWEGRRCAE